MEQDNIIFGLYDKVEQEKTNSSEYKKLLSNYIKLKQDFDKIITEEQKEKLDTVIDALHNMASQETKEFFKIGFLMSAKLMTETYCNQDI